VSSRVAATSPAATRGKSQTNGAAPSHGGGAGPPRSRHRPPHARKGTVRITPRAAILLFAIFLLATVAIAPARALLDQRQRLESLQRQAAELEQQSDVLEQRIADLNDPETLERLARECLGMVRPGEQGFVTIPKDGPPTPPDCG
jgi:cell division protein FtsB